MNSNVICTNNFSFFVIEAIVNKWDFIKSVLSVKEIIFSLVSLVRLTVLSVDYPFLCGVINLLGFFSVSES